MECNDMPTLVLRTFYSLNYTLNAIFLLLASRKTMVSMHLAKNKVEYINIFYANEEGGEPLLALSLIILKSHLKVHMLQTIHLSTPFIECKNVSQCANVIDLYKPCHEFNVSTKISLPYMLITTFARLFSISFASQTTCSTLKSSN